MKLKTTLLLTLLALLLPVLTTASDTDEWYPYVIPEKLDQNSPLNIGKLVLDAPAGKHGFVKVKEGHFYFEDGTRAKFWGTNLCFDANFPTKEQAKILADRIAYFGFNAVRLHHMDFYFEPRGIFEDVCPAFKDPQMKKTDVLSKKQLEKLDYFIYLLKQRGIYIDMNLLVARHFTEADGVVDAAMLGMAAKPYSMFDKKLIELQKKYAKDLLTHYNPYTKLRYCDDPAVALVEIINETTLSKKDPKTMPDYYKNQLTQTTESTDNIEKRYYTEIMKSLKKDIGVKCPITGSQYSSTNALEPCDFIDKHAYWDHPKFPNKPWDKNDFRIHNKSALLDKKLGIIKLLIEKSPCNLKPETCNRKPYTVTEWNHCYPNQYAYETPIILASEALRNNWDGLFQFNFSGGWKLEPDFTKIESHFNTIANPQQLILNSLSSLIFLKNEENETSLNNGAYTINSPDLNAIIGFIKDKPQALGPFTITTDQDGVVALLKNNNQYILFAISEVKNTDSGWNKEGKFNWGKPPVLLKRINVTVQYNGKTIPTDFSKSPYCVIPTITDTQ
ncbi:MAG: hypothetical protein PHO70_03355 [Candidatus Omnitrophica bacterium]|nr:hypothetical protein [Candidatus Omnitrophota bacterium]